MIYFIVKASFLIQFLCSTNAPVRTAGNDSLANYTDSIPTWLKKLYEKHSGELNDAIPSITFFQKLSDSTSYCLYVVDDGVCYTTYLATQKYHKQYKSFKIGNECDADFSIPTYSWIEYDHNSKERKINVIKYTQQAKASFLVKDKTGEHFKEGYNLDNAETIETATRFTIGIGKNGIITVIKNSR